MEQTAAHRQAGPPHTGASSFLGGSIPSLAVQAVTLARGRVAALNRLSSLARPADLDFAAEGFIPITQSYMN